MMMIEDLEEEGDGRNRKRVGVVLVNWEQA